MKQKTYQLPMYDERAENEYNTSNRTMTGTLGDWLINNYQDIGSLTQDEEKEYLDLANQASEAAWSDFNRDLAKSQSARNARSYNRYGSLTNTPALYEQETFGREANKAALNLSNNITDYYNSLVNDDINRQLTSWNQYSNMYNKAGEDITKLDSYNWNLRNQNKDRQYTNEVKKFQNKVAMGQALADFLDPLQSQLNSMKGQGGGGSSGGIPGGFAGLMNQGNSFLNNNQFLSGWGQDSNSFINSLNGHGMFDSSFDSALSGIDTSSSGWLDGISSSFGSSGGSAAAEVGSNAGSWFSSIADWFKGLGGK